MLSFLKGLTKPAAAFGLSLSLALGGLTAAPTQARAQSDISSAEVAQFLGGLLALYAIGRVISEADNSSSVTTSRGYVHTPTPHRHVTPPRQRLVAPARCFVRGEDANGRYRGYLRGCMERNVRNVRALPERCLRTVQRNNNRARIYRPNCLERNGWTLG